MVSRHLGYDDIFRDCVSATVTLARGESTWNPVCTSCDIWGPAVVEYRRHPDGGVDACVVEGHDGHAATY